VGDKAVKALSGRLLAETEINLNQGESQHENIHF
jgi:hypothetical protein